MSLFKYPLHIWNILETLIDQHFVNSCQHQPQFSQLNWVCPDKTSTALSIVPVIDSIANLRANFKAHRLDKFVLLRSFDLLTSDESGNNHRGFQSLVRSISVYWSQFVFLFYWSLSILLEIVYSSDCKLFWYRVCSIGNEHSLWRDRQKNDIWLIKKMLFFVQNIWHNLNVDDLSLHLNS